LSATPTPNEHIGHHSVPSGTPGVNFTLVQLNADEAQVNLPVLVLGDVKDDVAGQLSEALDALRSGRRRGALRFLRFHQLLESAAAGQQPPSAAAPRLSRDIVADFSYLIAGAITKIINCLSAGSYRAPTKKEEDSSSEDGVRAL